MAPVAYIEQVRRMFPNDPLDSWEDEEMLHPSVVGPTRSSLALYLDSVTDGPLFRRLR